MQSAERETCYADDNPNFSGTVPINGDDGDGDVLGATPPADIDRNAFQSPPPFTDGNTPRTLAFDLRNPSYFNQDPASAGTSRLAG